MDKFPCSWSRDFLFSVCCFDMHRIVLDCIERLIPRPDGVFWGVKAFFASFFPYKYSKNNFSYRVKWTIYHHSPPHHLSVSAGQQGGFGVRVAIYFLLFSGTNK